MEHRVRRLIGPPWVVPVFLLLLVQWEVWLAGLTHPSGPLAVTAATGGVAALLLSWRRTRPVTVQVAAAVVMVGPWLSWGAPQSGACFAVGMVAAYAVGRWSRGASTYLGLPVATGWILAQIAFDPLQPSVASAWGWTVWGLAGWGAGRWVRQQAEIDTRRTAEHDAEARALLAEQRLDIARDLHDVLASSLGVIVVQAEAAEELVTSDPERASQALRRVQVAGREGLTQVRAVLGTVRDGGGGFDQRVGVSTPPGAVGAGARRPPGLDDVESLIEQLRSAGLPVTYERRGDNPVSAEVGRVTYRLLQEALTNVVRHAGLVTTSAIVVVDDDAVTVEVSDAGEPGPLGPESSAVHLGNGLRGMRERLEPLGATLDVSRRPGGGMCVRCVVPTRPRRPWRTRPTRSPSPASTTAP